MESESQRLEDALQDEPEHAEADSFLHFFNDSPGGVHWWELLPDSEKPELLKPNVQLFPHQAKALTWMRRQEAQRSISTELAQQQADIDANNAKEKAQRLVAYIDLTEPDATAVEISSPMQSSAAQKALNKIPEVYFWQQRVNACGQRSWFNVANHKEVTKEPVLPRGGLLSDDMGLGKTLTTLACIAADWPEVSSRSISEPKRTLIVVPPALLDTWGSQASDFLCSSSALSKLCVFHGKDRYNAYQYDSSERIVITSYPTLVSEFGQHGTHHESPLYGTMWRRVVLDEAHVIKNRNTRAAQACWALNAEIHWALTGTPLQNSINDVYPILKLIKLAPFDDYEFFKSNIKRPLEGGSNHAVARVQALLSSITMRRTKTHKMRNGDSIVQLPKRTEIVHKIDLNKDEREQYDRLENFARNRVATLVQEGAALQHYMYMLSLLLRLRQTAIDPGLVPDEIREHVRNFKPIQAESKCTLTAEETIKIVAKLDELLEAVRECPICMAMITRPSSSSPNVGAVAVMTPCMHYFCKSCIDWLVISRPDLVDSNGTPEIICPTCANRFGVANIIKASEVRTSKKEEDTMEVDAFSGDLGSEDLGEMSSKTRAVVQYLRNMPGDDSVVVLSQFTQYLKRIESACKKANIEYFYLDGTMSWTQRRDVLANFDSGKRRVLLTSLRCCGVGLNLTIANHILLMDPWWNPAVEEQAVDRVYRLGQEKAVTVVRVVARDTIEERIIELHEDKRALAHCALQRKTKRSPLEAAAAMRDARLKRVTHLLAPRMPEVAVPQVATHQLPPQPMAVSHDAAHQLAEPVFSMPEVAMPHDAAHRVAPQQFAEPYAPAHQLTQPIFSMPQVIMPQLLTHQFAPQQFASPYGAGAAHQFAPPVFSMPPVPQDTSIAPNEMVIEID